MSGYPGGKSGSGVLQSIVNLMPPHRVYIEPFLGGGSVLLFKRPADINIGVDIDSSVVDQWRARYRIDGGGGPGPLAGRRRGGRVGFESVSDAWRGGYLRVECGCGIRFLHRYRWAGDELVYCDPPYVRSARASSKDLYRFEMTDSDHVRLLRLLRGLPAKVILSGYDSALYKRELKGWNRSGYRVMTRGGPAFEWSWYNFPPPVELHDYTSLGGDYRERERIKKKIRRWKARLAAMPTLERQALLGAIADTAGFGVTAGVGPLEVENTRRPAP